ncbi:hypothetical protein [Microbacterium sp. GCS4]|uniref:hypothetical protein n=1 Tax=Microbacterium sp. GCS4 TaxID=1692239 RepID=UPI0013791EE0|nr:hypothetical protein [Microbacterium sp. GCS4]
MTKVKSGLQRRIDSGRAEPISDRERAQLQEIREIYIRRFGSDPFGDQGASTDERQIG